MLTTVWYHDDDKRPTKSGHYLGYKLPTLGDDSEGYGVFYWDLDRSGWRESSAPHSYAVLLSIWADCPKHDPHDHEFHQPTVAEIDAWKHVQDAIDKYNMVRTLLK